MNIKMKIIVKAKAGAKEEKIKEISGAIGGEIILEISVKEPPIQGRANEAIVKVLSKYFNVSRSQISLISGFSSKNKIFEILV